MELNELMTFNKNFTDEGFGEFLQNKAKAMLNWMFTFSFSDDSFAMVNDASRGIAPTK